MRLSLGTTFMLPNQPSALSPPRFAPRVSEFRSFGTVSAASQRIEIGIGIEPRLA
ncbi:MAG: hypothetical protein RI897_3627, partial [Verrucomicrobiota bacterium]